MQDSTGRLCRAHLRRRLARAAPLVEEADFLFGKTGDGLMDRLAPMRIEPDRVLDLGCGTGSRIRQLEKRFPGSSVLGLDLSGAMLARAARRRRWFSRPLLVQAAASAVPLPNDSVDIVCAHMVLPFMDDGGALLTEVARVLRPEGLFVFATLGPDSFAELERAWTQADPDFVHVRRFPDMHIIGDAMVAARLRDPVIDVEHLEIRYSSVASLYQDLTAGGARNCLEGRRPGCTGRERLHRVERELMSPADGEGGRVSLELVFGHAWGGTAAAPEGEFRIAAEGIARRRRQA